MIQVTKEDRECLAQEQAQRAAEQRDKLRQILIKLPATDRAFVLKMIRDKQGVP